MSPEEGMAMISDIVRKWSQVYISQINFKEEDENTLE